MPRKVSLQLSQHHTGRIQVPSSVGMIHLLSSPFSPPPHCYLSAFITLFPTEPTSSLNQILLSDNPGSQLPPASSGLDANQYTLPSGLPTLGPCRSQVPCRDLSDPKDISLLLSDRIQNP